MRHLLTALIAFSLLISLAIGCKPYAPPFAHPVVDCVNGDRPAIEQLIASFWPKEGSPDWGSIEAQAISAGVNIGGCAIAEYVEQYTAPKPGTAAPLDGVAANKALEDARAKLAPDSSFKTKYGSL